MFNVRQTDIYVYTFVLYELLINVKLVLVRCATNSFLDINDPINIFLCTNHNNDDDDDTFIASLFSPVCPVQSNLSYVTHQGTKK